MNLKKKSRAFTLIEILVSMILMGMVLGSVAIAMKASLSSYNENGDMSAVTQTARSIMSKMSREIRTSEDVSSTGTKLTILPVLDAGGLTQIEYELQNGVLFYRRTVNGAQTSYTLLGGADKVQVTSFVATPVAGNDAKGQACNVAMTMKLTFTLDSQNFTVTASGAPRRNQLY